MMSQPVGRWGGSRSVGRAGDGVALSATNATKGCRESKRGMKKAASLLVVDDFLSLVS